jgi:hypothetical protein
MVFYLERLGQISLLAMFFVGFTAVFSVPKLLELAFNQVGKRDYDRGRRLSTFADLYRKRRTCAKLENDFNFQTAVYLVRMYRALFATFIGLYCIDILLKTFGVN